MNPMLKWIGGATAATLLVFGGATLASSMLDTPAPVANDPMAGEPAMDAMDNAIPVDEAKLGAGGENGSAQNLTNEAAASDAGRPGRWGSPSPAGLFE